MIILTRRRKVKARLARFPPATRDFPAKKTRCFFACASAFFSRPTAGAGAFFPLFRLPKGHWFFCPFFSARPTFFSRISRSPPIRFSMRRVFCLECPRRFFGLDFFRKRLVPFAIRFSVVSDIFSRFARLRLMASVSFRSDRFRRVFSLRFELFCGSSDRVFSAQRFVFASRGALSRTHPARCLRRAERASDLAKKQAR